MLENENTNVEPIPVGTGGGKPQPEMDALSSIVKDFNDTYGNIEWKNRDEVQRQIEELPARIATSVDFAKAARNGDRQVAQITFNEDISTSWLLCWKNRQSSCKRTLQIQTSRTL